MNIAYFILCICVGLFTVCHLRVLFLGCLWSVLSCFKAITRGLSLIRCAAGCVCEEFLQEAVMGFDNQRSKRKSADATAPDQCSILSCILSGISISNYIYIYLSTYISIYHSQSISSNCWYVSFYLILFISFCSYVSFHSYLSLYIYIYIYI